VSASGRFTVRLSTDAADDIERLYDFLIARELARPGGGDFLWAERAREIVLDALRALETTPFTCRKVGNSSFSRELVISHGATGYVALFEILDSQTVLVTAVRHQREDGYH